MNHVAHDCSTEDEGIDEDMMFEFEEELDARLTLQDDERHRAGDADAARPQNPVAALLQRANDAESDEFASLSASPVAFGSPLRMAAASDASDKSPSFDFNGRRKRKYSDDSCCVTPRVRPLAKRAKSFSSVDSVLLPDRGFTSISTSSLLAEETKPPASTSIFSSTARSSSIQIPHRAQRSAAAHHQRSSSGPARGTTSKALDVPAASSDPLGNRASSSWNASVEYFCRRSLDISSPLRIRFRDLVVSSVGRAGSLKSP